MSTLTFMTCDLPSLPIQSSPPLYNMFKSIHHSRVLHPFMYHGYQTLNTRSCLHLRRDPSFMTTTPANNHITIPPLPPCLYHTTPLALLSPKYCSRIHKGRRRTHATTSVHARADTRRTCYGQVLQNHQRHQHARNFPPLTSCNIHILFTIEHATNTLSQHHELD
ncbi:hypothetical protein CRENBAI_024768 [Crenichthys baileyi]|uniref:Uncharacterized protein n=1 Tax=Crenichthys baileyi TaxID=28760 RepID=A0AAV9SGL7_9TELE